MITFIAFMISYLVTISVRKHFSSVLLGKMFGPQNSVSDAACSDGEIHQDGTCMDSFKLSPPTCGAHSLITDAPVPGLHLTCVSAEAGSQSFHVTFFPNSLNNPSNFTLKLLNDRRTSFMQLRTSLEKHLGLKNRTINSWAIFSRDGRIIETLDAFFSVDTALIYEGGSFIWPGVRVGHQQKLSLSDHNVITMETISMRPLGA